MSLSQAAPSSIARRTSLLDFLLFHELPPRGEWEWNGDVHQQFFDALKDWNAWPSRELPKPLLQDYICWLPTEIEDYELFFDEEDLIVFIATDETSLSLNEVDVQVADHIADEIENKKDFYGVPVTLRVM